MRRAGAPVTFSPVTFSFVSRFAPAADLPHVVPHMSESGTEYRTGIDRMDHPLSHMAAVVAGVAFVFFAGSLAVLLSDSKVLRSPNWWGMFVLSASVMSACVIGYFRPYSRAVYTPVVLAGLVTLGLCAWHLWSILHPASTISPVKAVVQSLAFFGTWLVWAARTFRHLRGDPRRDHQASRRTGRASRAS